MVAVIDNASTAVPPLRRRRRRRKPFVIVAGVVLIVAVAVGVGMWRHEGVGSPPIRVTGFFGPYHDTRDAIAQYNTDLGMEIYLRGPVGTQAQWILGISNDGSHDVTVRKPEAPDPITNFQWSKYAFAAGGSILGKDFPLHVFPATISAHHSIRVIVTIKKPNCGGDAGYSNLNETQFHWQVEGIHRSTPVDLFADETLVPCPQFAK